MDSSDKVKRIIERNILKGNEAAENGKWERAGWSYYKDLLILDAFKQMNPALVSIDVHDELMQKLERVEAQLSCKRAESSKNAQKNLDTLKETVFKAP
ncbi:MAG: hypothetical protein Q6373_021795 [Candidatus Sigynarchaeota archaeon]